MNIAIVTETFPPEVNGVAMTYGIIARELGRRGHDVTVFRPTRRDLPPSASAEEYREVTLPGFPVPGYAQLRFGLPAGRWFRRRWQQSAPDLVHVATEGPLGASAIGAARAAGIPVTSGFHTNFHAYARHYGISLLRRPVLAWLRRVHNRTRRTFAPTLELCSELGRAGFRDLAVLSRGVDILDFHPVRRSPELRLRWGADADTPVAIYVGRMAPEKNYDLLFRAYAAMRRANPRIRFVLAGEGPLKAKLQREHPECVFAGFFSRQEIGRYYASADIFIHPSLTETFGNVLTEAMASGLAVAAFDYAAARQFIVHGENGLVAPFGDAEAFIDASVMLASDDLLRAQLRRAARRAVEQQTWANVVAGFEAELRNVAGRSPDRAEAVVA
ncbi:MAG TPA: glycosyltransferase family 1 protein [Opitutaceae bacterium]|nr:glycosyltransferase family 1 protein [Opitutaceae bacterium]